VIEEIENICQLEGVKKIIIGLPVSMQGKKTDMTLKVENFIHYLSQKINLDLETVDERFSTKEVAKQFQQVDFKNKKDAAAAALILQTYLDKNK
jgi:putative Holliday junction resolvase